MKKLALLILVLWLTCSCSLIIVKDSSGPVVVNQTKEHIVVPDVTLDMPII